MPTRKRYTKIISFEVKPRLLERFNEVCDEKGLYKSEIMRNLLNEYIEKNEPIKDI
jgi:metal-responsive CopG/Arc/MetJ family transcriptional regulator